MRKIYFLLFVCLFSSSLLQAQKNEVGFTMSLLSNNSLVRFGDSYLDDADYRVGNSITIGLTYVKPLKNWLDIETGIELLKCNASVHSIIPGYSESAHYGYTSILNIPVGLRVNFLKYCFVNGGILFDVDVSQNSPVDNQTGLGAQLGVGVKYDFKTGLSLFINPYTKGHALVSSSFNGNSLHLFESAIRFGVTYHF